MDKFGVLGVRNAWYDPSKVTDHVIQGYTKVRFPRLRTSTIKLLIVDCGALYVKTLLAFAASKIQGLGDSSSGAHHIHDHRFCICIKSTSFKEAF
jgi:hypothetical protein